MDKDGRYYCRADGRRCDVTRLRERYIKREQDIESAVEYAKDTEDFESKEDMHSMWKRV